MTSLFEGMAPALIQAGIPAVVGMQYPILDRSAARFIPAFYGAVSRGEPLTRAMTAARRWLYREGSWYIPTLYLRSGDPDGHLFPAEWPPSQEPVTAPPSEGEQSLPLVERQSLERQLAIHQSNLRTLREQAALYGAGTTPLRLVNAITLEEQAIQDIERRLGQ